MKNSALKSVIASFSRAHVLVVGDVILDEYIWGSVDRISPEAPVPVVWAKKHNFVPGGAANVAYNVRALGGKVTLVGATGDDKYAQLLADELKKRGVSTAGLVSEAQRHTTVKTRIIAGHQQVVRVDWEHTHSLSEKANNRILKFVRSNIGDFDGIIIEDYGKGVINASLLADLIELARSHHKIITVDPKEDHFLQYRGVTSITPNRKELENAVRNLRLKDTTNRFRVHTDRLFTDKEIDAAAREIVDYLGLESVLVTLGEQGMKLFERGGREAHIPTVAQEVFDVSGAGDTVIAAFTLGLCAKTDKLLAARIANYAAGIVVGKVGTAVTDRKELVARIAKDI